MSYYARLLDPFFSWLKLAVLHYLYRFSDGSKVQMDDNLAEELEDILDKRDPGMTGQHSLWQACGATAPFGTASAPGLSFYGLWLRTEKDRI